MQRSLLSADRNLNIPHQPHSEGLSVPDVFATVSPPCCWDSDNSFRASESGKRRVKHKDKPKEHFPSPFLWLKHICWKTSSRL